VRQPAPTTNETVRALRQAFDQSFARALQPANLQLLEVLVVRIGGDGYAIRLADIRGLYADRRVVPVPSPLADLLGVTGFRGQVVPVYDLGALLGKTRRGALRWMVLVQTRGRDLRALAFDTFEAYAAVTADRLVAVDDPGLASDLTARPFMHGAVRIEQTVRPILQVQSIVDLLQQRVDAARSNKER